MRIPKSFLVKGRSYLIKWVKNLVDEDGERVSDLTSVDEKIVEMNKDLTKKEKRKNREWVFWHAVGHAMLEESGVTRNTGGISDLAEEIICDNFADFMTHPQISVKFKRRIKK